MLTTQPADLSPVVNNGRSLKWLLNRLSRMSLPEILHRMVELSKKDRDRRGKWGWERFGRFDGTILSLGTHYTTMPGGVDLAGQSITLLGQTWPPLTGGWEKSIWQLDPVTCRCWPGAGVFASKVAYRHRPDLGDVKFVWELNRLQFLPALAASGDFEHLCNVLDGWMGANAPYDGINWTSGIEAASRIVSLLAALDFLTEQQFEQIRHRARAFLEAHTFWVARYPSLFSSANNHRVAELAALFLAGLSAPQMPHAGEYVRTGRHGLEQEVLRQLYDDGVGAEQSPTYTAYSLEWFVLAATVGEKAGRPFSGAYRRRVRAAVQHLRALMDDAGHLPRIGDDDEGRVLPFAGAPADYVCAIVERAEAWLGESIRPDAPSLTFSDGGYTVLRKPTQAGTLVVTFDHAPLGYLSIAAHGHADALSLWLHWGKQPVIIDAGTYLYHSGGAWRDHFRSTRAHNTMMIGTADQSRIAGPFNWSRHARTRVIRYSRTEIAAEHDGYLADFGIVHRRSLRGLEKGDRLEIKDEIISRREHQSVCWSQGFLLAPSLDVSLRGSVAEIMLSPDQRLFLEIRGGLTWCIEDAPYSPRFGVLSTTKRLFCSGMVGSADCPELDLAVWWHSGQCAEEGVHLAAEHPDA